MQLETIPSSHTIQLGGNNGNVVSVQSYLGQANNALGVMVAQQNPSARNTGGAGDITSNIIDVVADFGGIAVPELLTRALEQNSEDLLGKQVEEVATGFARVGGDMADFYNYTGLAFTGLDMGIQLAVIFGTSPNDTWVHDWNIFYTDFNLYATPLGWIELLSGTILGPSDTYEEDAMELVVADEANYNQRSSTIILNCQFQTNYTAGVGGAFMACHDNTEIVNSTFEGNHATSEAGATEFIGFESPLLINDAFVNNQCYNAHSAIGNAFKTKARIFNCTFLTNTAACTNGFAVGNETGANVIIGNSIFWNNYNFGPEDGSYGYVTGADVFTSTFGTLGPEGQQAYNDAGSGHFAWIAVCDIRDSDVQGLHQLHTGRGDFATPTSNWAGFPYMTSGSTPAMGDSDATYIYMHAGNSDFYYDEDTNTTYSNIGEGTRETLLNVAYGNISVDPELAPNLGTFPYSPGVNAGNKNLVSNGYIQPLVNQDLLGQSYSGKDMGATENNGLYPAGQPYYVDANLSTGRHDGTSWANAANTIPSNPALSPGGAIWVAQGTYVGSFSLPAGISIYGGLVNGQTTFSQTLWSSNHMTIVASMNGYPAMTIPGGSATVIHGISFLDDGLHSSASPLIVSGPSVVEYCKFQSNNAPVTVSGSTVSFIGCNFVGCNGGALSSQAASTIIRNCRFDLNTANSPNGGGACYLTGSGNTEIWGSEFLENNAPLAIGGGAIWSSQSDLNIQNCTIWGNTTGSWLWGGNASGAGVYSSGGTCELVNTILYENEFTPIDGTAQGGEYEQVNEASQILNCMVQGLTFLPSVNSFDADPGLFIEFAGFTGIPPSYVLEPFGQPWPVDSGTSAYAPNLFTTNDLAGNPRIVNGVIDIGAYEYQGAESTVATGQYADIPRKTTNSVPLTVNVECNGTTPTYVLSANVPDSSYDLWEVNTLDGKGYTILDAQNQYGGYYGQQVISSTLMYGETPGALGGDEIPFPIDISHFSGLRTGTLQIINPPPSINGYLFRLYYPGLGTSPAFITPSVSIHTYNPLVY